MTQVLFLPRPAEPFLPARAAAISLAMIEIEGLTAAARIVLGHPEPFDCDVRRTAYQWLLCYGAQAEADLAAARLESMDRLQGDQGGHDAH